MDIVGYAFLIMLVIIFVTMLCMLIWFMLKE